MSQAHDQLGLNYRNLRQPDYRIALNVMKALGKVRSVINVGAGTGSYEPPNTYERTGSQEQNLPL